jgi:hypothetical protein
MVEPPFEIISCSWPRPVEQEGDRWISEPEWDAPLMPTLPQALWANMHGELCWTIDWCRLFEEGLKYQGHYRNKGEMRGFHVVFRIRVEGSGSLVLWDDDGSIIRRNGEVIHMDRATHELTRNEIEVSAGDCLEIAQWQNYGGWLWSTAPTVNCISSADLFLPYLDNVQHRLRFPNGPALKIYTQLAELARFHWLVMKTCAGLLYPPQEYCFMDDDIFILDSVDDALTVFQTHYLVFAPDGDYSQDYLAAWGWPQKSRESLHTSRLNAGLYWLRNSHDPRQLAAAMFRVSPRREPKWQWEQSFLAIQFLDEPFVQLPTQRYFYPYFDGLPGDMIGYDYASNPCGFASIHYGGLTEKPSDMVSLMLAADILNRHANAR